MAAVYSLHADREPVAQKHKGHPPRGVVCLAKVRRQLWQKKAQEQDRARSLEYLRENLQAVQNLRLSALVELAQPDSVLAARARESTARMLEHYETKIAEYTQRLREL